MSAFYSKETLINDFFGSEFDSDDGEINLSKNSIINGTQEVSFNNIKQQAKPFELSTCIAETQPDVIEDMNDMTNDIVCLNESSNLSGIVCLEESITPNLSDIVCLNKRTNQKQGRAIHEDDFFEDVQTQEDACSNDTSCNASLRLSGPDFNTKVMLSSTRSSHALGKETNDLSYMTCDDIYDDTDSSDSLVWNINYSENGKNESDCQLKNNLSLPILPDETISMNMNDSTIEDSVHNLSNYCQNIANSECNSITTQDIDSNQMTEHSMKVKLDVCVDADLDQAQDVRTDDQSDISAVNNLNHKSFKDSFDDKNEESFDEIYQTNSIDGNCDDINLERLYLDNFKMCRKSRTVDNLKLPKLLEKSVDETSFQKIDDDSEKNLGDVADDSDLTASIHEDGNLLVNNKQSKDGVPNSEIDTQVFYATETNETIAGSSNIIIDEIDELDTQIVDNIQSVVPGIQMINNKKDALQTQLLDDMEDVILNTQIMDNADDAPNTQMTEDANNLFDTQLLDNIKDVLITQIIINAGDAVTNTQMKDNGIDASNKQIIDNSDSFVHNTYIIDNTEDIHNMQIIDNFENIINKQTNYNTDNILLSQNINKVGDAIATQIIDPTTNMQINFVPKNSPIHYQSDVQELDNERVVEESLETVCFDEEASSCPDTQIIESINKTSTLSTQMVEPLEDHIDFNSRFNSDTQIFNEHLYTKTDDLNLLKKNPVENDDNVNDEGCDVIEQNIIANNCLNISIEYSDNKSTSVEIQHIPESVDKLITSEMLPSDGIAEEEEMYDVVNEGADHKALHRQLSVFNVNNSVRHSINDTQIYDYEYIFNLNDKTFALDRNANEIVNECHSEHMNSQIAQTTCMSSDSYSVDSNISLKEQQGHGKRKLLLEAYVNVVAKRSIQSKTIGSRVSTPLSSTSDPNEDDDYSLKLPSSASLKQYQPPSKKANTERQIKSYPTLNKRKLYRKKSSFEMMLAPANQENNSLMFNKSRFISTLLSAGFKKETPTKTFLFEEDKGQPSDIMLIVSPTSSVVEMPNLSLSTKKVKLINKIKSSKRKKKKVPTATLR